MKPPDGTGIRDWAFSNLLHLLPLDVVHVNRHVCLRTRAPTSNGGDCGGIRISIEGEEIRSGTCLISLGQLLIQQHPAYPFRDAEAGNVARVSWSRCPKWPPKSQSCLPDQMAQAGVRCRHPLECHLLQSGPAYSNPGQTERDGAIILVCSVPYRVLFDDQVWKYGRRLVVAYVDSLTPMRIDLFFRFTNIAMVEVFLKFSNYIYI